MLAAGLADPEATIAAKPPVARRLFQHAVATTCRGHRCSQMRDEHMKMLSVDVLHKRLAPTVNCLPDPRILGLLASEPSLPPDTTSARNFCGPQSSSFCQAHRLVPHVTDVVHPPCEAATMIIMLPNHRTCTCVSGCGGSWVNK